jgi:glycosyltransferase involved in cell wall biosynthesis
VNSKPGIEVIICTYNGATRLPALFSALAAQTLSATRWSVLLVDNASTDSTATDARKLWTRSDVTLRVVREPKPGQMHARERGRRETQRDFVCFCDDDNLLAPNYLETALALIEPRPAVGVLGGCGEAVSDAPLPHWFSFAAPGYAVGPQTSVEGEVPAARGYVYGAGMIVRRSAWEQLFHSGFHSRLAGRVGSQLKSGDDNELCLALSLAGWKIHYSPRLIFQHCIPSRRIAPAYCRTLHQSFGDALPVLTAYRDFLLKRATPTSWKRCATLRAIQNSLLSLRHRGAPDPEADITAATLDAEIRAGRVAVYRQGFKYAATHALYRDIASWLPSLQKEVRP